MSEEARPLHPRQILGFGPWIAHDGSDWPKCKPDSVVGFMLRSDQSAGRERVDVNLAAFANWIHEESFYDIVFYCVRLDAGDKEARAWLTARLEKESA